MSETKTYEPKAAIWEKQGAKGTYLSLRLADGTWITFFKNKYKQPGDKKPDWQEAPKKGEEGLQDNPGGSFKTDDEIIPF